MIPFLCLILPWKLTSPFGIWNHTSFQQKYTEFMIQDELNLQNTYTHNQIAENFPSEQEAVHQNNSSGEDIVHLENAKNEEISVNENLNKTPNQNENQNISLEQFILNLQKQIKFNQTTSVNETILAVAISIWITVSVILFLRSIILYCLLSWIVVFE